MTKKYNCPSCDSRHTTEAWTYRTRFELGIVDIDSEDIIHLDNIEILKKNQNTFFCPTCGEENRVINIFDYNEEIEVAESKIRDLLMELIKKGGSFIGLKGKRSKLVSVDYNKEDNYFDVRYKDSLLGQMIEPAGDLEETLDYLMWLGVDCTFKSEYQKGEKRSDKLF